MPDTPRALREGSTRICARGAQTVAGRYPSSAGPSTHIAMTPSRASRLNVRHLEARRVGEGDGPWIEGSPVDRHAATAKPDGVGHDPRVKRLAVQPPPPRRGEPGNALQRPAMERRHDRTLEGRTATGGDGLDRGAPGTVLELDVEERPPADGGEHVRQRRHAEVAEDVSRHCVDALGPALHAEQGLVVDHDRHAIGRHADVELEPVAGRHLERREERGDRVLDPPPPVATMRQPERTRLRHAWPISSQVAIPRWSLG
jgi:hypothetical protein